MESFRNLYLHFPYCEAKCHYCDFFSLPEAKSSTAERSRVYDAIIREKNAYLLSQIETLFMGGGTPSLVPLDILLEIFSNLKFNTDAEITMEANPSSITLEKAKFWKKIGINRISMGVQALDDKRLEWLGRVHSKISAFQALDSLIEAGFERINTDYIVGVPEQSLSQIETELSDLLKRYPQIKHISAYLLTLKTSNSKFSELPDENVQIEHLRKVRDVLATFGLDQYEISNFSISGFEARHNENYWSGGSYLGIGPSAHSFDKEKKLRWKNWGSLSKYIEEVEADKKPMEWHDELDQEKERIEFLMLGLRRKKGISTNEYRQSFGLDLLKSRENILNTLVKQKLIHINGNNQIALVGDGFFLSDSIIEKLI